MKNILEQIRTNAFLDELEKIGGIGSLASMWIAETKGIYPKGTAVMESLRGKAAKAFLNPRVSFAQKFKPKVTANPAR